MYNVYGFGKRIGSYRRMKGITQEELATKLNITAQAVSKWENEISFPEITVLPLLAKELNTTIEKLFGNEEDSIKNTGEKTYYITNFAESKGANNTLKLVHIFDGVACYSEKEVDITNEDTVIFKDGSSANLRDKKIVNKGTGDINFEFSEALSISKDIDMGKTTLKEEFEGIYSIESIVKNVDLKLIQSKNDKTLITAYGAPQFIDGVKLIKVNETLSIKYDNENISKQSKGNTIIVEIGCDFGKNIQMGIIGSSDIEIQVPFENGNIKINGSGEINLKQINELDAIINGSGDIQCGKVKNAKVTINGSGDFNADEVAGFFSAFINGSGDIKLKNGELDSLDLTVRGSGDIDAEKISARIANIVIDGSGDIVIGWIKEESTEKHSKSSSIKVLKRGM